MPEQPNTSSTFRFRLPLITLLLAIIGFSLIPVSLYVLPQVELHWKLNRLLSNDPAEREAGLRYVETYAPDSVAVGLATVHRMQDMDLQTFLDVYSLFISNDWGYDYELHQQLQERVSSASDNDLMMMASRLHPLGQWEIQTLGPEGTLRWIDFLLKKSAKDLPNTQADRHANEAQLAANLLYHSAISPTHPYVDMDGELSVSPPISDQAILDRCDLLATHHLRSIRATALKTVVSLAGQTPSNRQKRFVQNYLNDEDHQLSKDAALIIDLWRENGTSKSSSESESGFDQPVILIEPSEKLLAEWPIKRIRENLFHESTPYRDLAVYFAIHRLDQVQLRELVEDLLSHDDPAPQMSGLTLLAMSDISLNESRSLLEKIRMSENANLQTVYLARDWFDKTQNSYLDALGHPFDTQFNLWMSRADLPRSTLLWMRLHRQPKVTVSSLFFARDPIPINLHELLIEDGWWPILANYWPKDAPVIDANANQSEQIDQFRKIHWWFVMTNAARFSRNYEMKQSRLEDE